MLDMHGAGDAEGAAVTVHFSVFRHLFGLFPFLVPLVLVLVLFPRANRKPAALQSLLRANLKPAALRILIPVAVWAIVPPLVFSMLAGVGSGALGGHVSLVWALAAGIASLLLALPFFVGRRRNWTALGGYVAFLAGGTVMIALSPSVGETGFLMVGLLVVATSGLAVLAGFAVAGRVRVRLLFLPAFVLGVLAGAYLAVNLAAFLLPFVDDRSSPVPFGSEMAMVSLVVATGCVIVSLPFLLLIWWDPFYRARFDSVFRKWTPEPLPDAQPPAAGDGESLQS